MTSIQGFFNTLSNKLPQIGQIKIFPSNTLGSDIGNALFTGAVAGLASHILTQKISIPYNEMRLYLMESASIRIPHVTNAFAEKVATYALYTVTALGLISAAAKNRP